MGGATLLRDLDSPPTVAGHATIGNCSPQLTAAPLTGCTVAAANSSYNMRIAK